MTTLDITALQEALRRFAAERDWEQFHSPKNLAMALSVEAAELVEIFQWLTEAQSATLDDATKAAVADEIADVQIYLARLADRLGIDIPQAVDEKLISNAQKYPADETRGSPPGPPHDIPAPAPISGVATSIAAFVGRTAGGALDQAQQIGSFAEFEQSFGGLDADSDLSYVVHQFFLNGGSTCWVVRTAEGAPATGDRVNRTGLYALEDVDIFNILCLPGVHDVGGLGEAIAYAEARRAMVIVDIGPGVSTFDDARNWMDDSANAVLKSSHAAAYFPRVHVADPLQNGALRAIANSGSIAGLWARTDTERGVWKSPAGRDAVLRGVQALDYQLSNAENGELNPKGLNALRTFSGHGTVSWGSRTLAGADVAAREWKYLPVRRTALFIEESVRRGTRFAASELNGDPLWAQIRLAVGSFMEGLFWQGAFQGTTPREAFFVKCDATTTTQTDIDRGLVNIQVGFAPLKPAEFMIILIQQVAGQGQT